jgi:acetyl coenzyme A synthetase (ADP forming)-like protein
MIEEGMMSKAWPKGQTKTISQMSEPDGYRLLSEYGIPVPAYEVVQDPEHAAAAAEKIGYPVVEKIVSREVVHKSDVGGVVTGIENATAAKAAFEQIVSNIRSRQPEAVIDGVIVERQHPQGLELIVGGRRDPAFEKVISFGLGGTLVELLRDIAIRVLPVDEADVRSMVRQIKGYQLIKGYRGEARKDEEAIVQVILAATRLLSEHPEVQEFDINPLMLYEHGAVAVDARFSITDPPALPIQKNPHPIDPTIFSPSSIAVIGASADPSKIGYAIFRNLLTFKGQLYAVNPNRPEILGHAAYPSVLEVPGGVDAAVIAVPARHVPQVMDECARKGVRLAAIVSGGFRETGPEGEKLEEQILATAKRSGMRIIGPNSLGIMLPKKGINATFDPLTPQPGRIGFISQSGAIITTIVDWAIQQRIGFSAVISVGNQIDLGFIEYLSFVEHDPDTKAAILYIEEIKDGCSFLDAVTMVSAVKPVVAIKSGASAKGRQAAASHTGSLAGSYEVYQAAFRQAGVIPAYSLDEAFDIAGLLASEGYPRGRRAIVVTSAGGFAVLSSDYAERYGIGLIELSPEILAELNAILPPTWNHGNPIDLIGDARADRYARVFDVLIRHQNEWDIAFAIATPTSVLDPHILGLEMARLSASTKSVVVGCMLGGDSMKSGINILRERDIPNYQDLEDAFRSVGRILAARLE